MSPRDNVWIAQRGYTPLTGCEVKGCTMGSEKASYSEGYLVLENKRFI